MSASTKNLKTFTIQDSDYCFDSILRVKQDIIIVKQLNDAEKLSSKAAENLKKISDFFEGIPIVIVDKVQGEKLPDDIVYSKHNIPVMTSETYSKMLKGSDEPLIYVSRGGIYVKIKKEALREKREKSGYSRGELAHRLGISRRAVLYYESGISDASLNVAAKLEEIFGEEIFEKMSINSLKRMFREKIFEEYSHTRSIARDDIIRFVLNMFAQLGFKDYIFYKTPFDAGAKSMKKRKVKVIIEKEEEKEDIGTIEEIIKVTKSTAIIISNNIEGEQITDKYMIVPSSRISKIKEKVKILLNEL